MANLRWRDQKNIGVYLAKSSVKYNDKFVAKSNKVSFNNSNRNVSLLKKIQEMKLKIKTKNGLQK